MAKRILFTEDQDLNIESKIKEFIKNKKLVFLSQVIETNIDSDYIIKVDLENLEEELRLPFIQENQDQFFDINEAINIVKNNKQYKLKTVKDLIEIEKDACFIIDEIDSLIDNEFLLYLIQNSKINIFASSHDKSLQKEWSEKGFEIIENNNTIQSFKNKKFIKIGSRIINIDAINLIDFETSSIFINGDDFNINLNQEDIKLLESLLEIEH